MTTRADLDHNNHFIHPQFVRAWNDVWARLGWAHGHGRAEAILSGQDPATERDLAAWQSLGTTDDEAPPDARGNAPADE